MDHDNESHDKWEMALEALRERSKWLLKAQIARERRLYGRGSLALEESKEEGCRRRAVEQEG